MTVRYLPWPAPVCTGMVCGIVLAGVSPLAAMPFLLAAAALVLTQPLRQAALLLVLLGLVTGTVRQHLWDSRADPLAGTDPEQLLELHGFSDGQLLSISEPMNADLWISPVGSVPAGAAVVRGRIDHAAGKRNPGGFDFRAHLAARDVAGQVFVDELVQLKPVLSFGARLRQGLRSGLTDQEAALTEAMTLGERSELGELRDLFAAAGLSHLLALSGLHLGVLAMVATRLFRRTGWLHRPLVLLVVTGFLFTVGVSASLLRAALMTAALLAGEWAGSGRPDGWTRLSLAALLTLLWRPAWLLDLSFQLSYLCLTGLLAFGPALLDRLKSFPWWHPRTLIFGAAAASVAAQLPTFSLTASTFLLVPLFSVPVNLLAIPLATLLVPLGLGTAILGAIHPVLAHLPGMATSLVAGLLLDVASAGARLPALPWGEVTAAGHWYWLVACLALLLAVNRVLRPLTASLVLCCALLASLLTPAPGPEAELIAFDVGQGDAFLLTVQGGPSVLVDAGGNAWSDFDPGERIVVPALRALGINSLDLVVATHADADHMGGLPAVLDALPVQALVVGVAETGRELYGTLAAAARRNDVPIVEVTRGEKLLLGELELTVLNPLAVPTGEPNEDSVALGIAWRGQSVAVMPGEVSARTEETLAVTSAPVLTVPHHGSRFSSSPRLLQATAGSVAVVSVGRNNYGHPHPAVIDRLEEHGYTVLTTMAEGAVRVPLGVRLTDESETSRR